MSAIDPTTGRPLPANAILRILFIGSKVHVYQIPPLASTKGYTAATWTADPQRHIFTGRLRILETGVDEEEEEEEEDNGTQERQEQVKVDIVLEDSASGQLFAAAPYVDAGVVEPALDSSRFFALRVQDGQGRRAVLGIGFEERPDAFDFGVALQEARKTVLGAADDKKQQPANAESAASPPAEKKDYSLKDGETITINLGGSSKFGRRSNGGPSSPSTTPANTGGLGGFSLPPPPSSSSSSSSSSFSLPPPPPAGRRTANRRSVGDPSVLGLDPPPQQQQQGKSAAELGFDDGKYGEFA